MLILLALIALILLWRIAHHAKRARVKRYRVGTRSYNRMQRSVQRQHLASVETATVAALREAVARAKANPTPANNAALAALNARLTHAREAQR